MVIFIVSFGLFGQDVFVDLEIEPKTVEVGQEFTITIKTNVEGDIDMNLPDEFIQSGMRQSGMSSSVEFIKGKKKVVRYSFQTFAGYFENEGEYLVGPVKVQAKKKVYSSDAYSVKVIKTQNMISDDPSKNMNQLIFGIIEQSKKEIYEGESVVLEGKVYSQVEILQIEDYATFKLDGAAEHRDLNKSNQVSTNYEVINGRNVQTFKIGKQLIFPEGVGTIEIKPFKTVIAYTGSHSFFPDRMKVISNEAKIKVKPLPAGMPKDFINAVGKFDVSTQIENPNLNQGEVVELKVKITGQGNLQNITKPKLNLPRYLSLYGDPEVEDEFSYCTLGAEGSKTFTYFIQVNTGGKVQLDPIKIAYFNPETKKYEQAEAKVRVLNVKSNSEDIEVESKEEIQKATTPEMQPFITEFEEEDVPNGWFSGWGGTALLFSPVMFGALLGGFVRVRKNNEQKNLEDKARVQYKQLALIELNSIEMIQDNEEEVTKLYQLFIDFLAQQFKVEKGTISRMFLKEQLNSGLSKASYSKIIRVFEEVDTIRYSGNLDNRDVRHLVDEVREVINSFEL